MSAVISPCGIYRYRLDRDVDLHGLHVIAYFGINPATADEVNNDQTVAKWIGFTQRNGGSRFIVGNIFAFRSADVTQLQSVSDPIGPENQSHLEAIIAEADILVPCWGSRTKAPRSLHGRFDEVLDLLRASGKPVMCFGKTQTGDPRHPGRIAYSTPLVPA